MPNEALLYLVNWRRSTSLKKMGMWKEIFLLSTALKDLKGKVLKAGSLAHRTFLFCDSAACLHISERIPMYVYTYIHIYIDRVFREVLVLLRGVVPARRHMTESPETMHRS